MKKFMLLIIADIFYIEGISYLAEGFGITQHTLLSCACFSIATFVFMYYQFKELGLYGDSVV